MNSIINLGDGYTIIHNDDGSCFIEGVYSAATECNIEFDGIKGHLFISDMGTSIEEADLEPMTLTALYEETLNFLNDWEVDEDIATSICDSLAPWFEEYAISESEAIAKRIAELEKWANNRIDRISELARANDEKQKSVNELQNEISVNNALILHLNQDVKDLLKAITEANAELQKGAK